MQEKTKIQILMKDIKEREEIIKDDDELTKYQKEAILWEYNILYVRCQQLHMEEIDERRNK